MYRLALSLATIWATTLISPAVVHADPLKVFVLAGQSNMQGHAQVRTLEHLGMDPKTEPILAKILDETGEPRTCDNVWISSIGHDGTETERHGKLSADYGAAGRGPKVGPEYTFGIYAQALLNQPVLIIKTAWGGKSINTDFRPPSAGPYEFNKQQLENIAKQGKDLASVKADKVAATGRYYRLMMAHVRQVLGDIKRVYPDYDQQAGYELAGFVWFQGWNDMVDRGVYPNRDQPGGYDKYSEVLAHFIRDIRKDLQSPELPFVIGVMGAGGPVEKYGDSQKRYAPIHSGFRNAMAAPAAMPEFSGNVVAVHTENYWDQQLGELSQRWGKVGAENRRLNKDASLSKSDLTAALDEFTNKLFTSDELKVLETGKSNAEYHYLGSGKVLAQIGKAFAEAVVTGKPAE